MTRPAADRTVQNTDAHRDGKITRDVVLTTALEIIDRDGADGLSMRRLARALDRDPTILYRHAPNKAALLDGVAEIVLAQLKVDPADTDWACQLRAVARDYRAPGTAPPHVVPPLSPGPRPHRSRRGPRAPCAARRHLTLLTGAGFSGPDALHIYPALFGFLHGHALTSCSSSMTQTRPTICCGWVYTGYPSANSPLRNLAPVLAAYDGAAEL